MDLPGKVPDSINCHHCNTVLDLTGQTAFQHVDCPQCGALSVVPLQFGNFLLLNCLGVGGMGTVYKAVDLSLNRYLALKILRPKLAAKAEFIESFSREARAAAAVSHPNIAQVYSFGEHGGQYYLAMELLERGSLDDRISTLGKVPEKDVLDVGVQVAAGLRAAHQRSLLHRDIKPGNILFNEEGIPKIVDFGLARAQTPGGGGGDQVWGTPYYIAPEKLRGQPEDFRSDMYSLGATLYHALAGRPPFDAATASEVATKHATQPAFSLKLYAPQVHPLTANLIGRMLSKNPAERYETYDGLIHDLHAAIGAVKVAQSVKVVTAPTGERVPVGTIIGSLAALVVCIVAAVIVYHKRFELGLERPPAPPSSGVLPIPGPGPTPVTPSPVASEGPIDFTANTGWLRAWSLGTQQLSQGNFQDALLAYQSSLQLTGAQNPAERRWTYFMQGLTLLAANRSAEALGAFARAVNRAAPRSVPADVHTGNFVEILAYVMTEDVPVGTFEESFTRLPSWAAALGRLCAALKHLEARDLDGATRLLREYQQLKPEGEPRWAFGFQPLASRLLGQCDRFKETLAKLDALEAERRYQPARDLLESTAKELTWEAFKPAFQERRDRLTRLLDEERRQQEARRQEEERRRQQEAERQRQRAEEEARLVQTSENETGPLLERYEFQAAFDKYEAFGKTLQSDSARQLLAGRVALVRALLEFKAQLAADFPKQPFAGNLLQNRAHNQLTGKLVRATDNELVFATPYGEVLNNWSDLPPTELVQMARTYARNAATTESAEELARRYLRLAVFCKQFNQPKTMLAAAQQAVKLAPSLEEELTRLVGPLTPPAPAPKPDGGANP